MIKEPTRTIYSCLTATFWTCRKCWRCQKQFTQTDYQANNYQLSFCEILNIAQSQEFPEPRDNACLEGVLVKLFHQHCSLTADFNYQPAIICQQSIIIKSPK